MNDLPNRRKVLRLPSEFPVEYLGKDFHGCGTVINLSPYGVLIRGDYLPGVGTTVCLRMVPSDGQGNLFVERAVVRWQGNSQWGVEIMTMTPRAYARVAGLMAAILRKRGCVCAPLLPWHCRCPHVQSSAEADRASVGAAVERLPNRRTEPRT